MERQFTTIAETASSAETKSIAAKLAAHLAPGDVILLSGDLGAGKTQFTQGLAAGLQAHEPVISPTFNIVITYPSGHLPLHHFDLYRLDKQEQLEDIGLREYLESDGVCVVEWAEKFPTAFDEHIAVNIDKLSEQGRRITACASGERFQELLSAWLADCEHYGNNALITNESLDQRAVADVGDRGDLANQIASNTDVKHNGNGYKSDYQPDIASVRAHEDAGIESPKKAVQNIVQSAESHQYVLAFDTANEIVAIAIGVLDTSTRRISLIATREVEAHRASNTTLIPLVDMLMAEYGIHRDQLACICVGRGPGSFTGVRIAMATAKGIAQPLGIGLVGVSTLDAIAWYAQHVGTRGNLLVIADAMRKEVYPVNYVLSDIGVERKNPDRVVKAAVFADEIAAQCEMSDRLDDAQSPLIITGDGLVKYRSLFEPYGAIADEELWAVTGTGLIFALEHAWQTGEADPLDSMRHNPANALPVYTRLSDAEENERIRLSNKGEPNLRTGVQDDLATPSQGRATMHASAPDAPALNEALVFRPLDRATVGAVAELEHAVMGTDAWSSQLVETELGQRSHTWWIAEKDGQIIAYAGGMIAGDVLEILKVAVNPQWQRHGIAREVLTHVCEDARNLGALSCSLEVRASNESAQAFYRSIGLESVGVRPRYYSDGEDAVIMQGALPDSPRDVAGMTIEHHDSASERDIAGKHPFILAIESSCDETAAAIVDGEGNLASDVVASQIDFHARFGGVVPEIASRKHIEAICGVCEEAFDIARKFPGTSSLKWSDLDAIAVTYAPGLLGALVVGVAYAKGAAWALDIPFVRVNHLEGHLYANKIGDPQFSPPAIVSLVSGGNTMLVHMRDWGDYETLGTTIDDAVGEAFDKVAKALGLGYPGGPVISKFAQSGDPAAIGFPRAMMHSGDLRFSLSGLKTAVVTYINNEREAGRELNIPDICASFQQAVVDVQVSKAKTALIETGARTFCLGGGVAANPALRSAYETLCDSMGVRLVMPPLASCGDNAGMIALVALDRYSQRRFSDFDADAQAHANLDEPY